MLFLGNCVYLRGNMQVRLATQCKFNLCPLAGPFDQGLKSCHSPTIWKYAACLPIFESITGLINSPHLPAQLFQNGLFSVFTKFVIKTKNGNHSMNKVKNLGYDRWLIYKQPHQESGLCCFSFTRYLQKCVTKIYRALYGDAMFVFLWGTQTWWP